MIDPNPIYEPVARVALLALGKSVVEWAGCLAMFGLVAVAIALGVQ